MMKKTLISLAMSGLFAVSMMGQSVIRVNQMGYLEDDVKVAVMLVDKAENVIPTKKFSKIKIVNAATNKTYAVDKVTETQAWEPMAQSLRIDFSSITEPGEYYIEALGTKSGAIKIDNSTYKGAQEIP